MKQTYFLILGLMTLALLGCSDDEGSCYPPVYQGFLVEPSTIHAGDSVFVTASQQKKGHYLNATDYEWSMTVQVDVDGVAKDSTLSYKRHTNYGGTDSSDPQWRLKLPQNTLRGQYTCSFKARWSNSADALHGASYNGGTAEGCTGSITSYSYTLYSQANGTCRLVVR